MSSGVIPALVAQLLEKRMSTRISAMARNADLHLRVVGCIVEHHPMYQKPRLEAVKSLVLHAMQELSSEAVSLRQIQEVLCFAEVPLVSEYVLRQALNSLRKEGGKIELVDKAGRIYRLLVEVPRVGDTLDNLLKESWNRHFVGCVGSTIEHFRNSVALLFARYGCAAVEVLTSQGASAVRIKDVLESLDLQDEAHKDFRECFDDFVLSHDPADANLKVRLASVYVLLRMNGAGNWEKDDLRRFFKQKRLLLDTNILFEIIGRNISQVTRIFQEIKNLGASLQIGRETIREIETALRRRAEQVAELVQKGVDLPRLIDQHVLRGDWVKALVEDNPQPTRVKIFERVDNLLAQVEGILESSAITQLNLECSTTTDRREERIKDIQSYAVTTRGFKKRAEVALHDALLWEAVEDAPKLAELILTLDRSLGHVRSKGQRIGIMLDEVVACALMGGAGEQELADIFSHTLSQDLHPDVAFLSMDDVSAIAGMESSLLNGPPRALRAAAAKLAAIRNDRLISDDPVPNDEIGRILVAAISAYREDRAQVEKEREGRVAAEKQVERLRNDLGQLKTALNEREAFINAELKEHTKRESERDRKSDLNEMKQQKRRDWMLFGALLALISLICFFFRIPWAGVVALTLAVVSLLWSALAQETPPVSLRTVSLAVSIAVAVAGIVEKSPEARRMIGISPTLGLADSRAAATAPRIRPFPAPITGSATSSSTSHRRNVR